MNRELFAQLKTQARRRGLSPADAEDLVQDGVVAGLLAGRCDAPYLHGIVRNLAAMRQRGDRRRLAREQRAGVGQEVVAGSASDPLPVSAISCWLTGLSPASRQLAVLALAGMNADEIRWLLGLSTAAFRQRVAALRSVVRRCPPELRACLQGMQRQAGWPTAPRRLVLKRALSANTSSLAAHDVDGHVLVVRKAAHVSGSGGNG